MQRGTRFLAILLAATLLTPATSNAADPAAPAPKTTAPVAPKAAVAPKIAQPVTPVTVAPTAPVTASPVVDAAAKPAPATAPTTSHGLEAGAISRATGAHFREGMTASFAAEGANHHTLKANDDGLLTRAEDGAFAPELWAGQSKGDIRTLLENLAPNPVWPNTLALARRALLTDAPWPEGDDLQALRLKEMIDFGAVTEAAHLYNHLGFEHPDPAILKQGVRALLMTGEPSVACLEFRANSAGDKSDAFFADMDTLCTALLMRGDAPPTPAPQAPAKPQLSTSSTVPALAELAAATAPTYAPTSLNDLLALGPTALDAIDVLPGITLSKITNSDIPDAMTPGIAGHLAHRADLSAPLRLKLFSLSSDITPPAFTALGDVSALPASEKIWIDAAQLLIEQSNVQPAGIHALAKKIAALPAAIPLRVQTLFVPTLERLAPTATLTPAEVQRITALLLAVDSDRAAPWIGRIRANLGDTPVHSVTDTALLVLGQTRGHATAKGKFPLSFSQLAKDKQSHTAKILKNLSELLDTSPVFIDNPVDVYEKKADLTQAVHYVIPVQVLRGHLSDAKEKRQIGRMVLASLLTLQGQTPEKVNSDVLLTVLNSLIALGMEEEARQIATTVLLGVIITGEN